MKASIGLIFFGRLLLPPPQKIFVGSHQTPNKIMITKWLRSPVFYLM
jgi:hypothetical protein